MKKANKHLSVPFVRGKKAAMPIVDTKALSEVGLLFNAVLSFLQLYFFKISLTGKDETGEIDEPHFDIPGSRNFTILS